MNEAFKRRSAPIVPAKLTRPRTHRVLPRERLFHSISVARENKVIWISGPAGSGKTTLAASYLESQKRPCLWYQVDEGDDDLATFFYYLGIAAKIVAPRNRKLLPLFTPEYFLGIPVFAKRYFELLTERLMGRARPRSSASKGIPVIVFDNYQDIPEASLFHMVINASLDAIPLGMNVFILSRSEPPPAFAGRRNDGQIHLIDWKDIRLTREESNAIALIKAGREIPDATLTQLYQTTDGWAAGIVLLMESMRIKDYVYQRTSSLPQEDIFSYFATELFDRMSHEKRTFLIETAFLPTMNTRTAKELTGNIRAGQIFSDLNRKNYFIYRYDSFEQTFQYHPLFREFLQTKAAETLALEHLKDIKRRAAHVLEANAHSEDAVVLFCGSESWSEAGRVILSLSSRLILQGRWQTLWGWIASLPDSVMNHQPWLIYWKGVSMLHACPPESLKFFEEAFDKFKKDRDQSGIFLSLSGMFESIGHTFDSFIVYDRLIPMMNALLEEFPQFPSPQIEARIVNSMLWALMLRQPVKSALQYWENRGFSIVKEVQEKDTALSILLGLVYVPLFAGDLEKVEQVMDSFQDKFAAGQDAPLTALMLNNFLGNYFWLAADFGKSIQAVEDGLALAEHTGIHFFDALLQGHGAACSLSLGETAKADHYLQGMQAAIQMIPSAWAEGYYHCLEAWSCLLLGSPMQSSMHADLGIKFCAASGSPLTMTLKHVIKAMAMHTLKEVQQALAHLSEFWKICEMMNVYQVEFMAFLLEAQIAFDSGNEASGRDLLRKAMIIGREHKYASTFFWIDATMAKLCVKALEAGIETEYVQNLIRKRNLVSDVPVLHLENWPWSLKLYTLGPFGMVRDGEPVRFSGKIQKNSLLLLKILIAFGGRNVKEEHLCDAIWPDAEGDLAHRSLETTIYRLRKLIGKDTVKLNEGCLTLNQQSCWVDAFALEQVLNEAEKFCNIIKSDQAGKRPPRNTTSLAIQLTKKAIDLYKGHFLESEPEQSWLLVPQKRLRAKYTRSIAALAGYWETAGELEMAIKCYEKALEVDDLAEELYQHLMRIHYQLGRWKKSLEVYDNCRSVLDVKLGLEPSHKTEALIAKLRDKM